MLLAYEYNYVIAYLSFDSKNFSVFKKAFSYLLVRILPYGVSAYSNRLFVHTTA